MKFEIIQILPVYDSENKVIKTNVTFKPNEKSIMVIDIEKDLTQETREIIIAAILEQIYNDWFPNKAENEKFKEVNETLKNANEEIISNRKAFNDMIIDFTRLEDMIYELAEHTKYNFEDEVIENDEQTIEEE